MFTGAATTYTANGGILSMNFYDFGSSSLVANPGRTIKYSFGGIFGGFLNGAGNHDITSLSKIFGSSFGIDAQIQKGVPLQLINVTNNGVIDNPAGKNLNWNTGTNTSDGRLFVNGTVDINNVVSNGQITIQPGASLNNSASALVLGAGSKTLIGSASNPGGAMNLGGQTLEVSGQVVNNGTINGTTNINSGGLVQGNGNFGPINVLAGGKIYQGNDPWILTTAS